jgi:hypothetical protein
MTEIPRIHGAVQGPARVPTPQAAPGAEGARGTPAFEALLERLTSRSAELEARAKSLASPADLSGALDAAKASFEDALRLGEGLLEAVRAARLSGEDR